MLCAFVVLQSRFAFHKAGVLEYASEYVILVLCHTTECLSNAEWPAVGPGRRALQAFIWFILCSLLDCHSYGLPHPFHAGEWTSMKQGVTLKVSPVFGS